MSSRLMKQRKRETLDRAQRQYETWLEKQESDSQRSRNLGGIAKRFIPSLRSAFAPGYPGYWSQDHWEQTQHFTGWNYVSIRAIGLQLGRCTVAVYQDMDEEELEFVKTRRTGGRVAVERAMDLGRIRKSFDDKKVDQKLLPKDHRLCRLIQRPTTKQAGFSFRYEQAMQLGLTGVNLVWMCPNRYGVTVERYVIPTALATPIPPSAMFPSGAWKITPLTNYNGYDDGFVDVTGYSSILGRILPAEVVEVIRWPHPLYKGDGFGPLAGGAWWSDAADMVDRARWAQMRRGANPSIMVSPGPDVEMTPEDQDSFQQVLEAQYSGAEKTGTIMVASSGTEVTALQHTALEMAYEQSFEQMRDSIMALHGCPAVAAGVVDGGSYAAYYASLKQFAGLTIQPQADAIAEEDTEQQAKAGISGNPGMVQFGSHLSVIYTAPEINDEELLERQLQTDIAAGIRKVNEFRSIRGLDPLEGAAGEAMVQAKGAQVQGSGPMGQGQDQSGQAGQAGQSSPQTTGMAGAPRPDSFGAIDALQGGQSGQRPDQPTTGQGGSPHVGVNAQATLTGPQIQAAKDVLSTMHAKEISQSAAIEMLVRLGFERPASEQMVTDQLKLPEPKPELPPGAIIDPSKMQSNGDRHPFDQLQDQGANGRSPVGTSSDDDEDSKGKAPFKGKFPPKNKGGHDYSCAMLLLPIELEQRVLDLGKRIDRADLSLEGRENEPHITVLVGLHTNNPDKLKRAIAGQGPIKIELGATSLFPASDSDVQRGGDVYDIVKIDVESPQLLSLHNMIASTLPNTATHPKYNPHITLAYCRAGEGHKYAGLDDLEGSTAILDRLVFSDQAGKQTELRLRGSRKRVTPPSNGNGNGDPRSNRLHAAFGKLQQQIDAMKSNGNGHAAHEHGNGSLLKNHKAAALSALEVQLTKTDDPAEMKRLVQDIYGGVQKDYDPDQPRDESGKWSREGGGAVDVSASAVSPAAPEIQRLNEKAANGNTIAAKKAAGIARAGLRDALRNIGSAHLKITNVTGAYAGQLDVGVSAHISYDKVDRHDVFAAIGKYGRAFAQEEVHVRSKPAAGTALGDAYSDGSFNTQCYRIYLSEPLPLAQAQGIIQKSGLAGLGISDHYLEAYYAGDPKDEKGRATWRDQVFAARQLLGQRATSIRGSVARLWRLSDDGRPGTTQYERTGSLNLSKSRRTEAGLTKNCGTGSGGFQPGNTCAGGDGDGQTDGGLSRSAGPSGTSGLRDGGRLGGSPERVEPSGTTDRANAEPLKGLPRTAKIQGVGTVEVGPFVKARQAALDYMREAGLPYNPPTTYVKVDKERASRIADAFDKMKDDPNDPHVKDAYAAMAKETIAQYQAVKKTGLKVEFIDYAKQGDPYAASPRMAIEDMKHNNHFWVFPTHAGFGSNDQFDSSKNPLLAPTSEKDVNGHPMCVNDVFRVVHDYFGHAKEGNGMRADGEENAWRSHSAMYSPLAREAMTSETRGQNSWVNFGPQAEHNRTATGASTIYADQKIGLLPQWCVDDGRTDPPETKKKSIRKDHDVSGEDRDESGKWTGGGSDSLSASDAVSDQMDSSAGRMPPPPNFHGMPHGPFKAADPVELAMLDERTAKVPTNEKDLKSFMSAVQRHPYYQETEKRLAAYGPPEVARNWSLKIHTNPDDSLEKSRQLLHEDIVKDFLNPKAVAAPGKKPIAFVVMGNMATGKTTAAMPMAKQLGVEYTHISPDDIKEKLPENEGWNNSLLQGEACSIAKNELLPRAVGLHQNIQWETTGLKPDHLMKQLSYLGSKGYDVHLVNVSRTDPETIAGAWNRFRNGGFKNEANDTERLGRYVPLGAVNLGDHKSSASYKAAKELPFVKGWMDIDMTGNKLTIHEQGHRDG